MPIVRLAAPLCLLAVLLAACEKPAASPEQAVIDAVVTAGAPCTEAIVSMMRAGRDLPDLNLLATARDACNTSAAAIEQVAIPAEMKPEQASLFATTLHDCAQAQSNMAEAMGMATRRNSLSGGDRARMSQIERGDRRKACGDGLEAAMAGAGGKLSKIDKVRLLGPDNFS
jgi:hypothetical protein